MMLVGGSQGVPVRGLVVGLGKRGGEGEGEGGVRTGVPIAVYILQIMPARACTRRWSR